MSVVAIIGIVLLFAVLAVVIGAFVGAGALGLKDTHTVFGQHTSTMSPKDKKVFWLKQVAATVMLHLGILMLWKSIASWFTGAREKRETPAWLLGIYDISRLLFWGSVVAFLVSLVAPSGTAWWVFRLFTILTILRIIQLAIPYKGFEQHWAKIYVVGLIAISTGWYMLVQPYYGRLTEAEALEILFEGHQKYTKTLLKFPEEVRPLLKKEFELLELKRQRPADWKPKHETELENLRDDIETILMNIKKKQDESVTTPAPVEAPKPAPSINVQPSASPTPPRPRSNIERPKVATEKDPPDREALEYQEQNR